MRALFTEAGAGVAPDMEACLMLECVRKVAQLGRVYPLACAHTDDSPIPALVAQAASLLEPGVWSPEADAALAALPRRRFFFVVIDLHPRRRKRVPTLEGATAPSSLLVDRLAEWGPSATRTQAALHPLFGSELVAVEPLAPWLLWPRGLSEWEAAGPSDVAGCVEHEFIGQAAPTEETPLRQLPVVVLWERLAAAGWVGGRGPSEPRVDAADRVLDVWGGSLIRGAPYARCPHVLPELLSRGLRVLHYRQPVAYYEAVLRASASEQPVPGKRAGVRSHRPGEQ